MVNENLSYYIQQKKTNLNFIFIFCNINKLNAAKTQTAKI